MPFAAGTQLDLAGRIVAAKLADALGQPVVVDNRPGASGNIGSDVVAKAAPDGYTLLLTGSFITSLPSTMGSRAVDPIAAFAPISKISEPPMMIVVNPSLNVNSLDELVALARKAPGRIAYSTPGVGTSQHLAATMLQQRTGIELLHVPYANGGQALNDVVSGTVPVYFSYIGAVEPFLRSGQLKALAVATGKRATNWPDVPTVAELGYKDFAVTSWNCVLAPAGTSPEIIERLHGELARIVQQPDVRAQFLTMGSEPMSNTPENSAPSSRRPSRAGPTSPGSPGYGPTDAGVYSALRSASPSGAPSPVHASHPALALYAPLSPTVMSRKPLPAGSA